MSRTKEDIYVCVRDGPTIISTHGQGDDRRHCTSLDIASAPTFANGRTVILVMTSEEMLKLSVFMFGTVPIVEMERPESKQILDRLRKMLAMVELAQSC